MEQLRESQDTAGEVTSMSTSSLSSIVHNEEGSKELAEDTSRISDTEKPEATEEELEETEYEEDDGTSNENLTDETRDLKLKELPLVHKTKKKTESPERQGELQSDDPNKWLAGGTLGGKGAVMVFRCSALSERPPSSPGYILHMTYKTIQAETKLLGAILHAHGMREVHPNIPDFNLLWTGVHPKPHTLRAMTYYQRVNHFPRSYELTRKDRLYKNIEKMQHAKGGKHFDFIPQTFIMPNEFREFCSTHYRIRGPWIVKPVASSRGRGIFIINSPDQVPLEETVVVAKYIDNPLLVDGHKCDLRLYVAVTSYDPLLIYMYEEGLVRFATVKYDSSGKHLWNPCMHLCNYSINKYHSDYIKSEDPEAEDVGHKWTLSALLRHLRSQGLDTGLLMQRIEEVVVKAVLATAPPIVAACKMFVPHPHNCFELYGFDILIDATLKPWLLEVNLSPSLGCDSPLDVRVKSAMLADLLTLIGIPAVDPMVRRAQEAHRTQGPVESLKKLNCRRVQSADTLLRRPPNVSRLTASSLNLTPEESRIIRAVRAEFDRRGGFVRIFPSLESWRRYSAFLDPQTGVASTTTAPISMPCVNVHNYNLMLHQQLFPDLVTETLSGRRSLPDQIPRSERFIRYERALLRGHRASLSDMLNVKSEASEGDSADELKQINELKEEVRKCLENGSRLSQYQARRAFGLYLACVLRRLSGPGRNRSTEEGHSELILRFLQRASTNLRTPYFVKIPSRKLAGKDRVAVIAKQLNDFIYLYNRETELYSEVMERPDVIPSHLFQQFLTIANETDLEEVLTLQTRLYKCAHIFLGRCGPPAGGLKTLGLLRSLPDVGSGSGDCDCLRRVSRCSSKSMKDVQALSQDLSHTSAHSKSLPRLIKDKSPSLDSSFEVSSKKSTLGVKRTANSVQSSTLPPAIKNNNKKQLAKVGRAL